MPSLENWGSRLKSLLWAQLSLTYLVVENSGIVRNAILIIISLQASRVAITEGEYGLSITHLCLSI